MHTLALYRKYRPQSFADVVGQEHIIDTLKGAIEGNKVPHAYLFVGPRGTGKTSTARILARELGVSDKDLYEIDAASNNGVDEIRELREAVRTLPFESPYKFYIIDEVHMLSKQAFNAFLKTLEEPPAHVKFVLATTELHKVLDTIRSRCQQLSFKSPSHDVLSAVVKTVAEAEGVEVSDDAARLVAQLGDGSFRDTLGMLQKVLSGVAGKKVEREHVERFGGAPKEALVNDYLRALLTGDAEKGLVALEMVREAQHDVRLFAELVMQQLRLVMFRRYAPSLYAQYAQGLSEDAEKVIKELAEDKELGNLSEVLSKLLGAYGLISTSYIKTLPLELLLIS